MDGDFRAGGDDGFGVHAIHPELVFLDEVAAGSWWVSLAVDGDDRDAVLGRAIELLNEARDAAAAWVDLPQPPTATPVPSSPLLPPPRGLPRRRRGSRGCNGS